MKTFTNHKATALCLLSITLTLFASQEAFSQLEQWTLPKHKIKFDGSTVERFDLPTPPSNSYAAGNGDYSPLTGEEYDGSPARYHHTLMYGPDGRVQFYIIDGNIYDQFGYRVFEISPFLTNPVAANEIEHVVVVPREDGLYYVQYGNFYFVFDPCAVSFTYNTDYNAAYGSFPTTQHERLGDIYYDEQEQPFVGKLNNSAQNFALSNEINADKHRILALRGVFNSGFGGFNQVGIKSYIHVINPNASTSANVPVSFKGDLVVSEGGISDYFPGEIEIKRINLDGQFIYRVATPGFLIDNNDNEFGISIFDLDQNGNITTGVFSVLYVNGTLTDNRFFIPFGVEFSPSGEYIYTTVSDATGNQQSGCFALSPMNQLFFIEFGNIATHTTATGNSININGFGTFNRSEIESSISGKLYVSSSTYFGEISNPDNPFSVVFDPIKISYSSSISLSDYTNWLLTNSFRPQCFNRYLLHGQVDDENYSAILTSKNCCNHPSFYNAITWNVTADDIWTPTSNPFNTGGEDVIRIKDRLTVEENAHLENFDLTFEMGPESEIFAEKGTSTTHGGIFETRTCTLTVDNCEDGSMWTGIISLGDNGASQTLNLSNIHGKALLYDSHVEWAKKAVHAPYNYVGGGTYIGGGMVYAQNSSFHNNRVGIQLDRYDFDPASEVLNCEFVTNEYLVDYGSSASHEAFIHLTDNTGIDIRGNVFQTDFGTNTPAINIQGIGIQLTRAGARVEGDCVNPSIGDPPCQFGANRFINQLEGIYSHGSNSLDEYLFAWRNEFDNCFHGINLISSSFADIYENHFSIPDGASISGNGDAYGIRTEGSHGFAIRVNTSDDAIGLPTNYGVVVTSASTTGGDVSYNELNNNTYGIQTEQFNGVGTLGLALDCNDLIAIDNTGINIAPFLSGSLKDQGDGCSSSNHRPGNEFYNMACTNPPSVMHIVANPNINAFYYEDPDNTAPSDPNCVSMTNYVYCGPDDIPTDCSFDVPFDDVFDPEDQRGEMLRSMAHSGGLYERQYYGSELTRHYLLRDSLPGALEAIQLLPHPEKYKMLTASMISRQEYALAQRFLDSMPRVTEDDTLNLSIYQGLINEGLKGNYTDSALTSIEPLLLAAFDTTGTSASLANSLLGDLHNRLYALPIEKARSNKRGVEEIVTSITEKVSWFIIPNPSNASAILHYDVMTEDNYQLVIFNTVGKAVYEGNVTSSQYTLPKALNSGLYFVQIADEAGRTVEVLKWIVQ